MRFLKQLQLNRRDVKDQSIAALGNGAILLKSTNTLQLPKGSTAQIVGTPAEGMIRYNTDNTNVQVYQGSTWRNLRYAESQGITQQNLGAGDDSTIYFGPLSPTPPSVVAYGQTWGGQNLLVIVENVIQLNNTNYTVVQATSGTPITVGAETYTPKLSFAATVGSTTLYFNSGFTVTNASWSGGVATLTFATRSQVAFATGSSISVTGIRPSGYNGTYTVTGGTTSTVTYALVSDPGTYQNSGEVVSANAVYPSVNIVGAAVTGTNIQSSTVVSSFVRDTNTGALISVVISKPTITGTIASNTTITLTETSQAYSDNSYWLKFSSPVPYGKTVTALIGFDQ
jgi:hypothetical protein